MICSNSLYHGDEPEIELEEQQDKESWFYEQADERYEEWRSNEN